MTTQAEYNRIAAIHGRRVANRVILADTKPEDRSLIDFNACYGSEDQLPEHERGTTPLIVTFDPIGRNVHYEGQNDDGAFLWPEPGSVLAPVDEDDSAAGDPQP